jgi:hypothetical protein
MFLRNVDSYKRDTASFEDAVDQGCKSIIPEEFMLEYYAIRTDECVPIFRTNIRPPSAEFKNKPKKVESTAALA